MSNRRIGAPKRRDSNERAVVRALRDVGASVIQLNETGVPDLLVGWCSRMFLLEVKRPLGPRGGSGHSVLTEAQVDFRRRWKGPAPIIVRSDEEALCAIGALSRVSRLRA